ncbi:MAG: hypothetical protein F9K17_15880 [Phycisphaerae bacterium]|nr:MAG: hypothetical protein F9K17_15880 [Phycisphaerae bacterium]
MNIPKSELPDIDRIANLARRTLPEHYRLLDVRCDYGSGAWAKLPDDFEIVIEYENLHDPALAGSMDDIEMHQAWANLLLNTIRAEWPPSTVRIAFCEKLTASD